MRHPNTCVPDSVFESSTERKLEYFSKNFLLNHQTLNSCRESIKKILFKKDQYQIINITGPTGVGKTELAKNTLKHAIEASKDNGITSGLPAAYVEIPVLGGVSFDWKGLYIRILDSLEAPPEHLCKEIKYPKISTHGRGYSDKQRTEGQIRKALEKRIIECKLKVLIFDEVQHLFKFSAKNTEKSLDILKSIANLTGCQVVLIGTYESLQGITWSGQLSRRTKNIHFHRYNWSTTSGAKGFAQAYMGLLAHIPHELDPSLYEGSSCEQLYRLSCGCIGILKQTFERALDHNAFSRPLSLSDLANNALSTNELIQIAREISDGEEFFQEESLATLDSLLGMPAISQKKSAKKNAQKKQKPGQRNPHRDKAGIDA